MAGKLRQRLKIEPMKTVRSAIFWVHVAVGAAAGLVVLIMSVTGVALTYEKQMLEWADRGAWTAPSQVDASPLPPETLLARVTEAQPGTAPTGITLRATGKMITGAANLGFLFLVVSGLYLWFPRVWTWLQFKNVLWFRGGLAAKARHFNWDRPSPALASLVGAFLVYTSLSLALRRLAAWLKRRRAAQEYQQPRAA